MLKFQTYFLPKDNRSEAWLTEVVEQTADKRTSSYKKSKTSDNVGSFFISCLSGC